MPDTLVTRRVVAGAAGGSQNIHVTPKVTSAFSVTPGTARTLNPDGPPKGEATGPSGTTSATAVWGARG